MFLNGNEELEVELEDTDDADIEEKDSEDVEDKEDIDEEEDADKGEDDSPEDDDKPLTRGELKKILQSKENKKNAGTRIALKKGNLSKTPKPNERLDQIEQRQKSFELLERKRTFAYENGLSPQETDLVFKFEANPNRKTLLDPAVKGMLEGHRTHKNVKANIPRTRGANFKVQDKSFADLKPAEKQTHFADRRRALLEEKKAR